MNPHDEACEREVRERIDAMRAAMNDDQGTAHVGVEDFSASVHRKGDPWTASVSLYGDTRLREALHSLTCFCGATARAATDALLAHVTARFDARREAAAQEFARARAAAEAWEAGVPAWSR